MRNRPVPQKGEVFVAVRGQHTGQVIEVRKASEGKVYFQNKGKRNSQQRDIVLMNRDRFEVMYTPVR